MKKDVVYIAGKITDNPNYKEDFKRGEDELRRKGFEVILNPTIIPENLDYANCMKICRGMVEASDYIYFLKNWENSNGAKIEYHWANELNKTMMFE